MQILKRILPVLGLLILSACQTSKPIIQHSLPMVQISTDTDSDNDGVPDSKDQCPNTPLNVVVDAKGCPIPPSLDSDFEPVFRLFFPKNQPYPYDNNQLFTQNPDILRQHILKSLEEPLTYTKNHPEKTLCLLIEGHASKGKYGDTFKDIDLQRALTVKQMYKEWLGFKEENIKVEHYGAERPIAPNDTPEHTLMNQRVYTHWYSCSKVK